MSGDLSDLEVFAQELQSAILADPWINDRRRIAGAIDLALQKTLSRRALSQREEK